MFQAKKNPQRPKPGLRRGQKKKMEVRVKMKITGLPSIKGPEVKGENNSLNGGDGIRESHSVIDSLTSPLKGQMTESRRQRMIQKETGIRQRNKE